MSPGLFLFIVVSVPVVVGGLAGLLCIAALSLQERERERFW
jgi:hypothetical protein